MINQDRKALTYAAAGVSIDEGEELVRQIKADVAATARPGTSSEIGGFGGIFDLKQAGYKDPLLVAATDGVGTKVKIAIETGCHEHIGQDLVAMCVNDLVVQGAEPLFFLDYYACGELKALDAATIVRSIARACKEIGCALIGGETAEMPGLYKKNDYDLAGFAVGAVEREKLLPCLKAMQEGDIILGLASSGVHANGFSLVRKIVERSQVSYEEEAPFDTNKTLKDALLTPTKLYVKQALMLHEQYHIKAFCHVTGGGFWENIPRILPPHLAASLTGGTWQVPEVFRWLKQVGEVREHEMLRTFNCGIGMIVILPPHQKDAALQALIEQGEKAYVIGEIEKRQEASVSVSINDIEKIFA